MFAIKEKENDVSPKKTGEDIEKYFIMLYYRTHLVKIG
jgi:hypothetical protein